MAQKITGAYALTQIPWLYRMLQEMLGGERARQELVADYIRPRPGDRVLDIGCGPATILPYLGDVSYTGFDLNPEHIAQAESQFSGRGRFSVGDASRVDLTCETFDLVLCLGLLHHLDDDAVISLVRSVRPQLAPGGRFFAIDPVFVSGQHWIARRLAAADSGQNVREVDGYTKLIERGFPEVRTDVRHNLLRVPYSHCIITASVSA